MKKFASKEAEKDYYEHEADEAEFIAWYKEQDHPSMTSPQSLSISSLWAITKKRIN